MYNFKGASFSNSSRASGPNLAARSVAHERRV